MPSIDHFGLLAPHYDRLATFRRGERMAELLRLPTRGSILDAAGGTGRVAQHLAPNAGLALVIDESRPMLRRAASKPGLAAVQAELVRALGAGAPIVYVHADVCRADLLVELEAQACHLFV